jgi:type IV pilus assembly protein PilE
MRLPSKNFRNKGAGFSLIELMVAVSIAGILLAIAIPSYSSYMRRSRRTEARSALVDLAGREERYYNTNGNQYTSTLSNLGYTAASSSSVVGNGYYTVTVASAASTATTPSTYSITAAPNTTDQNKDTACLYFYIDSTGLQKAGASAGAAVSGSTCWLQ